MPPSLAAACVCCCCLCLQHLRSCPTDAGLGLFTTSFIAKNCLITEYVGPIINRERAEKLRDRNRHSHVRALNCQFSYIDGIKKPVLGMGGASFANDGTLLRQNNAVFFTK